MPRTERPNVFRPHYCGDSCGIIIEDSDRPYLPGHALRHLHRLRRLARQGDESAWLALYTQGWTLNSGPGRISFGFEAEFFGIERGDAVSVLQSAGFSAADDGYHHTPREFWRITEDGSVNNEANELVSPILRLVNQDVGDARRVVRVLREAGGQVDRSCGLHVHHNTEGHTIPSLAQMVAHYVVFTPLINTLVPRSRHDAAYCRTMLNPTHWYNQVLQHNTIESLRRDADRWGRYHTVNMGAMRNHGTIEFRQHSGTLNGDKIEHWTRFTKAIMNVGKTKDYADLINTHGSEASVCEEMGLAGMFEYLGLPAKTRTFLTCRAEQLAGGGDGQEDDNRTQHEAASDGDHGEFWCESCQTDHDPENEESDSYEDGYDGDQDY